MLFVLPTPPPPPLFIIKPDLMRDKLLKRFEHFDGCQEDELSSKIGRSEDKDPECMSEAEGTGIVENPVIDTTDKSCCGRCEQWIENDQIDIHRIAHSSQILDWMYLGAQNNAHNFVELTKRTNISYILNVAKESFNIFPEHFGYKHVTIRDESDEVIEDYFDECYDFIENCKKQGKNILIHCVMGMSRSATMVLMFLMRGEGMNLLDAWTLTKGLRSIVIPNPTFAESLCKYEHKLFGRNSIDPFQMNTLCKQMID